MHDTAFTRQPWFAGRIAVPADAKGGWLTPGFAEAPISADMVYTTAGDYALLLKAVLENTGVSAAVAQERDRVQVSEKDQLCPRLPAGLCPEALGSGLSWQILRFKEVVVLMHTGHDPGVSTFAYLSPTTHEGVVILTNGENGGSVVPDILSDLRAPEPFVAVMRIAMKR